MFGDGDLRGHAERHARHILQPRIEELLQSEFQREPGEIEYRYAGTLASDLIEPRIGKLHHARGRAPHAPDAI